MKRIQTAIITILIAIGLWFLLKPTSTNKPEDGSTAEQQTDALTAQSEPPLAAQAPPQEPLTAPSAAPVPRESIESSNSTPTLKPLTEQEIVERRKSIRATLSGIYTAQAAYFAEYDRYSSDLGHIGYLPAEGTIKARFGFLEPHTPSGGLNPNEDPSRSNSDAFTELKDDDGETVYQYDDYSRRASLAKYERYCDNRCSVSNSQFELISAVNLDSDETLDVWIIDSRKNIRHVVDDTKE
ncbi:MAG: hypothetical protein U1E10_07890 [Bdellovibrionales bacterium]|jgi:hypothetical protein|nr:hypothetical protein [Bdellovibrionales bacterium]